MDIENQRKSLRCAVLQLVYLRLMILQGSNIEIGGHGGLMVKRVAQRLFLSAMGQLAFQSLQNLSEALIQESHGFIYTLSLRPRRTDPPGSEDVHFFLFCKARQAGVGWEGVAWGRMGWGWGKLPLH